MLKRRIGSFLSLNLVNYLRRSPWMERSMEDFLKMIFLSKECIKFHFLFIPDCMIETLLSFQFTTHKPEKDKTRMTFWAPTFFPLPKIERDVPEKTGFFSGSFWLLMKIFLRARIFRFTASLEFPHIPTFFPSFAVTIILQKVSPPLLPQRCNAIFRDLLRKKRSKLFRREICAADVGNRSGSSGDLFFGPQAMLFKRGISLWSQEYFCTRKYLKQ